MKKSKKIGYHSVLYIIFIFDRIKFDSESKMVSNFNEVFHNFHTQRTCRVKTIAVDSQGHELLLKSWTRPAFF